MTAPALGGRRATRGTTRAHVIAVSPHLRPDGTRHPNAFEARLAGAPLCVSETPLLDAARALLARDIAQPDDTIVMRHVGSHVDALRARVGVAAELAVEGSAVAATWAAHRGQIASWGAPCRRGPRVLQAGRPSAQGPLRGRVGARR